MARIPLSLRTPISSSMPAIHLMGTFSLSSSVPALPEIGLRSLSDEFYAEICEENERGQGAMRPLPLVPEEIAVVDFGCIDET